MDTYSLPSICQVKNLENIITINIKNRTIVKIYLIKILKNIIEKPPFSL